MLLSLQEGLLASCSPEHEPHDPQDNENNRKDDYPLCHLWLVDPEDCPGDTGLSCRHRLAPPAGGAGVGELVGGVKTEEPAANTEEAAKDISAAAVDSLLHIGGTLH